MKYFGTIPGSGTCLTTDINLVLFKNIKLWSCEMILLERALVCFHRTHHESVQEADKRRHLGPTVG